MPAGLVRDRSAIGGIDARRWLESLPGLVEVLLGQWGLRLDGGDVSFGESAVVIPVCRDDAELVLKVDHRKEAVASEAVALAGWDGQGSVRLLESEPTMGALLLERLDPTRDLFDIDLWEAAPIAARLLSRLAKTPAPSGIPRLNQLGGQLSASLGERNEGLGRPVPTRFIEAASRLALDLCADAGDRLVHGDLHYGNILAGSREPWLVVDSRAVAGDPEYAIPELLWTRFDELDGPADLDRLLGELVAAGSLNMARAVGWAIVRPVDYWLWGIENGLTEDPKRCTRIVEHFCCPTT